MIVLAGAGTHLFGYVPDTGAAQHVNAVLRDLESAARLIPNFAKLVKKFTSHSGRSGGATEANEHSETQAQWIGPRGGWDLGGLQTMFEYIYGTTKTDGRVGRALSGWKHVDRGGFCPGIECIDASERNEFALYSANLMAAAPLDLSMKYALVCVLLLHFDAVQAACPQHDLLTRMITCSNAGVTRVKHWAQQIQAAFHAKNGSSLPSTNGEISVPVVEMQEMSTAMRDYEGEVRELKNEISVLKQAVQTLNTSQLYLTELLEKCLGNGSSVARPLTSEVPPPVPSAPRSMTSHFQRSLPLPYTPSSQRFPSALVSSLQNLTMSTAFHRWYNEELFKCTTATEKETKVRRKLLYAVTMMKRFLPANTVIRSKPDSLPEYQEWSAGIQQMGDDAQIKLLELCTKAYNAEVLAGNRTRKRVLKPMLEGMNKRLGGLYKRNRELFPSEASAIDDANSAEGDVNLEDTVD